MIEPDLLRLFVEPLERLAIPYIITGGVATVIYGDPRFTRDIDLVLLLQKSDVARLASEFEHRDAYVPPRETMEEEVARGSGHFNLIDRETGLRADVYLAGGDPLHAWAFERRVRIAVEWGAIWVAPLEYVILRKLQYFQASGSDRHLRDVSTMLRISGDQVDRPSLDHWIDRLGLAESYERALLYEE